MQQYASMHSVLTPTHSTPGLGQGLKFFFLKVVMLHIKLIGMEHRAPRRHIFCPTPWGGLKVRTFFLDVVILHVKLKGIEQSAPCKHIFCPVTHILPQMG